ncbi:hypothetical protein PAAG_12462 [Paracoccidioides lutzii Pb01]|uniref:Uncharacterized protein n=1 Tax=Paracoccidioides lutzii (strain ATCC MYA-826 / Pb01) TaxID=502779 RepID=A0A0A2V034_PARBA|nr:hypothetical protein PAAG_12462 [Paracoccidioides lutzii Pb01]KGQ00873.1 hypothetical protein PAAG_12462 [Paracoccidioides lutzii Pb01]
MHRDWGIEEDIYLATLRLGTDILWHEMEKNVHPDKKSVSDVIDDSRHYGPKLSPSPFEAEVIAKALSILAEYPNRRLW